MNNINALDSTNKYVQGSVWKWVNSFERRAGVQSSERPVLIISNNTFNTFSPSVNCITITSVLKESPVHVPLFITMDSHIQCEQIHTVPKTELVEFKGMVSKSTLSQVKAKIRIQFALSSDKNTELFNRIKKSVEELNAKTEPDILNDIRSSLELLNEKVAKGFDIQVIENEFNTLLSNLQSGFERVRIDIESLKNESLKIESLKNENKQIDTSQTNDDLLITENTKKIDTIDNNDMDAKELKTKRSKGEKRSYTDEDKIFIADPNNSIDVLMERYGYSRSVAHNMRSYFKKRIGDVKKSNVAVETKKDTHKVLHRNYSVHRKYSIEDKRFIIDENNSVDALIERFQFKDKHAAYRARSYIKRVFVDVN